jgi:ABC-type polysaccharide/polyol phosphate export permease
MTNQNFKLAVNDVVAGLANWRIWGILGWQDIRLRYRRSQLGPFWITLSTAILVYSMGFLYGALFKVDLAEYYPYLASGIISWTLISNILIDSNEAFINSHAYIKQIKLHYSIFILQVLTRNFIIFLHNLLVLIPIIIFFHVKFSFISLVYLFIGMAIIFCCGLCYGSIFAIIGTRYRDIKQLINSVMQVIFMLTPIVWQPSMLPPKYLFLATANPLNQIINLVRAPLTGHIPSLNTFLICCSLLGLGLVIHLLLLSRSRQHIPFWI